MPRSQLMQPPKPDGQPFIPRRGLWRFPPWAVSLCLLASLASGGESKMTKPKSINELKDFFQLNCARCHGLDGSAHDPHGRRLGGLNFIKATQDFRRLSGPASEREIRLMVRTVRKGILFGFTMPAWRDHLSQGDAELMVRDILLKAEEGKFIEPETEPESPQMKPADPARKARSLNELKTFFQHQCTRCHGSDGSGQDLRRNRLAGADFTKIAQGYRTQTGLASDREVRTMIRTVQKGIFFGNIMPSWEGNLSLEDATLMIREIVLKAEKGKIIAPEVPAVALSASSAKPL